MAKKVRGHRANKPNDSFGTINADSLYKGSYRKDVYEDPEDEESEEQVEVEATQEEAPEGFSEVKQESTEHDYKKRYDDLKRHYDAKLKEHQEEKENWESAIKKTEASNVPLPKTAEELEQFKSQYPDVYDVVQTVAAMQATEQSSKLEEEIADLRKREKELKVQTAYRELKSLHSDFDELRKDEKFLSWLEEQPQNISDGITKNNTDVKWAARVIDLYKIDAGIVTKKKRTSKSDAATAVSGPQSKEVVSEAGGDKQIWKASQIAKMKPWEFEKFEGELDKARAEGRIDYNS
tara:strand:- start:6 stop:884 length:879 start_codon:yes stop_codon:yes gene_type:complete